jgi:hypothetical protein
VFTKEELCHDSNLILETDQILDEVIITEEDVRKKLSKLRADKASGVDGLAARFLAEVMGEISHPVYLIFVQALKTGQVVDDWKLAYVTTIYKKGSRVQAGNYRPVSLTSQLGKLLESLIRDKIVEFLETNQVIRDTQHGFRRGRSCVSNLMSFLDKVTGCIDQGDSVDAIFFDLAKAFDKVPHQRLMAKIKAHGITGSLFDWVQQWILGRQQCVCIDGTKSDWLGITSGVPQGSVLGPVLFLIYINDLDCTLTNWILKFADDTKLFGIANDTVACQSIQADVDKLVSWTLKWQMPFNVDKCSVMHYGHNNQRHSYWLQGVPLKVVESERDLGVIVSSNLKVTNQCRNVFTKANRTLGIINRTVRNKRKDIIIRLYKTLVRPQLEFCTTVWNPSYIKDKALIERIQHRVTKMIPSLKHLSYEDRLSQSNLLTLEERRNRADLIEVYKMANGLSSVPLERMFKMNPDSRTRGHKWKLMKPHCALDIRRHFFSDRVINRWNSLHSSVVEAATLNSFKSRLENQRCAQMGLLLD